MTDSASDLYALYRRAEGLLADGRHEQAVEVAEDAVRQSPDSASLHELLGRALYRVGARDRAAAVFMRLADLEPTNAYAHFGLGRSLEGLGDLVGARRHLRLATALSDRRAYARHLARVEERVGDVWPGEV